MWLKKLNESIQLNPNAFLTLDGYLASINDLRHELASENIRVHGKMSELIGEFRSMTRVDTLVQLLHQREGL